MRRTLALFGLALLAAAWLPAPAADSKALLDVE
jgi:hypothetical protein